MTHVFHRSDGDGAAGSVASSASWGRARGGLAPAGLWEEVRVTVQASVSQCEDAPVAGPALGRSVVQIGGRAPELRGGLRRPVEPLLLPVFGVVGVGVGVERVFVRRRARGDDGKRGVGQGQPAQDRGGDLGVADLGDASVGAAAFVAAQGVDSKDAIQQVRPGECAPSAGWRAALAGERSVGGRGVVKRRGRDDLGAPGGGACEDPAVQRGMLKRKSDLGSSLWASSNDAIASSNFFFLNAFRPSLV